MNVWIVTQTIPYEGGEPVAVFSQEKDAMEYKKQDTWNRDIVKLTLDKELS